MLLATLLCSGVVLSGYASRKKSSGLFQFFSTWDPSILISLFLGLVLNCVSYNIIKKKLYEPLRLRRFPKKREITLSSLIQSIIGSILMGFSWGLGNTLPSSMIANFQFLTPHIAFVFFPSFVLGQIIGVLFFKLIKKMKKKQKGTFKIPDLVYVGSLNSKKDTMKIRRRP